MYISIIHIYSKNIYTKYRIHLVDHPSIVPQIFALPGLVFDLSLFGTWTWIPDEIFRRFDWPSNTKDAAEKHATGRHQGKGPGTGGKAGRISDF